jgi:hypothetical protein
MRSFDISEFKNNGMADGFLQSHYFLVMINRPAWSSKDTRFLMYLASAATLPGSQIITADERVTGYGLPQKIPFDVGHTDVNINFYSDGAGESVAFFEEWLRNTVSYGGDNIKGAERGELQYPDHYTTTVQIFQYNERHAAGEVLRYTLEEAFPVNISEQNLEWSGDGALTSRSVTFAFRDYKVSKNSIGLFNSPDAGYDDYLQQNGFNSAWSDRNTRSSTSESITSGNFGIPGLSSVLGAISGISGSVSSVLSAIGGIGHLASNLSSLSNFTPSISSFLPPIPPVPSFSGFEFP